MSEKLTLHFNSVHRHSAIEDATRFVSGVRARVLPIFAEADTAYEAYVHRMREKLGEESETLGEYTEAELEEALTLYDDIIDPNDTPHFELEGLANQLFLLSLAGLYHQWERTIKKVLWTAFRENGFEDWHRRIHAADFDLLRKWLVALGFPTSPQGGIDAIDTLRLIVNVVKHGNGSSCVELAKKDKSLFWQDDSGVTQIGDAERLQIQQKHLEVFEKAIITFWNAFPTSAIVSVKTIREPELPKGGR